MTAVYLPYGSSCDVVSNKGHFQFDPEYYGIYYLAEQVAYTCNSGVLSGKLNLAAPELESGKYIHFDASGCDPAHAALGGLWRTPSKEDFEALASAATWEFDRAIGTVAHEYVDMGYHVGWAKYNLGASSDHEPGAFY